MEFRTDSATVSYDILHPEKLGDHVPLLLLHSALGARREFDKLCEYYPDRTIILPDFPSHGQSTTTLSTISTADLARWIRALLVEGLHIPVVEVIGYSMGGYAAIELALQEPRLVKSIVSHAMKFYWTPQAIADALDGLNLLALKARSEKAFATLSERHVANGIERTAALTSTLISSLGQHQLGIEDLLRIQCPLLLSVGDSDTMVPPQEVAELYQHLPKEKTYLAIHPNSPHALSKLDLGSFSNAARIIV